MSYRRGSIFFRVTNSGQVPTHALKGEAGGRCVCDEFPEPRASAVTQDGPHLSWAGVAHTVCPQL